MQLSAFAITTSAAGRCALPAAAEPPPPTVSQPGHHPQIPPLTAPADVPAPKHGAGSMTHPRKRHTIIPNIPSSLGFPNLVPSQQLWVSPRAGAGRDRCMCPLPWPRTRGWGPATTRHTRTRNLKLLPPGI